MDDKKTFIIAISILVGIFAAIIAGSYFYKESKVEEYNNYVFQKQGILWKTTVQKGDQPYTLPFYYPPWELEDIVSDPSAEQLLLKASLSDQNESVFITLDPDLKSKAVVAAVEISRITGDRYNMLNLPTKGALTRPAENRTANTQNPIVTCEAANNQTIVIKLMLSNANVIHEENGCIILEGKTEEDLLRVADKFAYKLIGVVN